MLSRDIFINPSFPIYFDALGWGGGVKRALKFFLLSKPNILPPHCYSRYAKTEYSRAKAVGVSCQRLQLSFIYWG